MKKTSVVVLRVESRDSCVVYVETGYVVEWLSFYHLFRAASLEFVAAFLLQHQGHHRRNVTTTVVLFCFIPTRSR